MSRSQRKSVLCLKNNFLSVFPFARLLKKEKDYNIFTDGSHAIASVAELSSSSAMPLKTYEAFEYDPLNIILNGFSKIPKDGSGAAIQIIFSPQGDTYTKRYTKYIEG